MGELGRVRIIYICTYIIHTYIHTNVHTHTHKYILMTPAASTHIPVTPPARAAVQGVDLRRQAAY
jgi:hypothetical protein